MSNTGNEPIAQSPCIGDCRTDVHGVCIACFMTMQENDKWNHVSNSERLQFLKNAEERKKAKALG